MQVPSIGRIVLFEDKTHEGKHTWAAVITHVWSSTCVNLSVLQDGSFNYPNHGPLPTSVDLGDGDRQWRWPERV